MSKAAMRDGEADMEDRFEFQVAEADLFSAERFPVWMIALDECLRGYSLLAFELQFKNLEARTMPAAQIKTIAFCFHQSLWQCSCLQARRPYLQILAPKTRVCPGPRLESAKTIRNLNRRPGKVNEPIFFLEYWRKGRL